MCQALIDFAQVKVPAQGAPCCRAREPARGAPRTTVSGRKPTATCLHACVGAGTPSGQREPGLVMGREVLGPRVMEQLLTRLPDTRHMVPGTMREFARLLLELVTGCKGNQALVGRHLGLARVVFGPHLVACGDVPTQVRRRAGLRRVSPALLREVAWPHRPRARAFAC